MISLDSKLSDGLGRGLKNSVHIDIIRNIVGPADCIGYSTLRPSVTFFTYWAMHGRLRDMVRGEIR